MESLPAWRARICAKIDHRRRRSAPLAVRRWRGNIPSQEGVTRERVSLNDLVRWCNWVDIWVDRWLDNFPVFSLRKENQDMQEDFPRLLTVQQAARKSGKAEKTIYRWINDGKLVAEQPGGSGGAYLIKREDLEAVIPQVTKEWQEQSNKSQLHFQVAMLEAAVEELQELVRDQERDIEQLAEQVKKLQPKPKKKPTTRRTSSTRTRRKTTDDFW